MVPSGMYIHDKREQEMKKLIEFLRDEEGLTTVEYAVAGALVVAGLITAFTTLGDNVEARITELATTIAP
jgi:pilus assembly protein Flp/PilA